MLSPMWWTGGGILAFVFPVGGATLLGLAGMLGGEQVALVLAPIGMMLGSLLALLHRLARRAVERALAVGP